MTSEELRAIQRMKDAFEGLKRSMARMAVQFDQTSRAWRRKAETFQQVQRNRYMSRQKRYYDPGKNPKPRRIITLGDDARIAKPTRQQRRAIEREQAKHKEQQK